MSHLVLAISLASDFKYYFFVIIILNLTKKTHILIKLTFFRVDCYKNIIRL